MSKVTEVALYVADTKRRNNVDVSPGVTVPARFVASFRMSRDVGLVELDVKAEAGRARIAAVRVVEDANEHGVTGVTIGGVPVADLLVMAVERMAFLTPSSGGEWHPPADRELLHDAAVKASRKRMSDTRLERIAAMLAAGKTVAEVAESENVTKRYAYRLVDKAKALQT